MHRVKKEFQVLDSLPTIRQTRRIIEKLVCSLLTHSKVGTIVTPLIALNLFVSQRAEIVKDVEWANRDVSNMKYPDVSKWPIISYDIPKQQDG